MVALVTSKPRFYHEAASELKRRGIPFQSYRPDEKIPSHVTVVITSPEERGKISFHTVVAAAAARDAVREAVQVKEGLKGRYESISLGVDPGKSIGVAAVGRGRILMEEILRSPEEVARSVRDVEEMFLPKELVIKVGAAGGSYRNRIIARLQEEFTHPIQIIDEVSTTRPKWVSRRLGVHKDISAARKIALKTGREIKTPVNVDPASGEIKNIQRESRRRSAHITISKELAKAVAKGELDMDEAIELQKKGGS
ncbi:MAG: hypothetical protein D6733_07435 [Methanobacteriota archaeon]|nr:MAG: hypothetical protein D6733_07435 [Euryarchaeota archaeon]